MNDANPASAFDCAEAFGYIAIAAGEHDCDDTRAESPGRRLEERISRGPVEVDLGTRIEHALARGLHGEVTVRGRQIYVPTFDGLALRSVGHRERRTRPDDLVQEPWALWMRVKYDEQGGVETCRQRCGQVADGGQAAKGGCKDVSGAASTRGLGGGLGQAATAAGFGA